MVILFVEISGNILRYPFRMTKYNKGDTVNTYISLDIF